MESNGLLMFDGPDRVRRVVFVQPADVVKLYDRYNWPGPIRVFLLRRKQPLQAVLGEVTRAGQQGRAILERIANGTMDIRGMP